MPNVCAPLPKTGVGKFFDQFKKDLENNSSNQQSVFESTADYGKLTAWIEDPNRTTQTYDFMDGKNPDDWDDYDEQTELLGQSTIDYFDTDGDCRLSQEEYDIDIFDLPFEELDFRLNENYEIEQDGFIDASEMAAYWEYIDTYDMDGKNGKINIPLF